MAKIYEMIERHLIREQQVSLPLCIPWGEGGGASHTFGVVRPQPSCQRAIFAAVELIAGRRTMEWGGEWG